MEISMKNKCGEWNFMLNIFGRSCVGHCRNLDGNGVDLGGYLYRLTQIGWCSAKNRVGLGALCQKIAGYAGEYWRWCRDAALGLNWEQLLRSDHIVRIAESSCFSLRTSDPLLDACEPNEFARSMRRLFLNYATPWTSIRQKSWWMRSPEGNIYVLLTLPHESNMIYAQAN